jgi:hypothetical protein
MTKVYKIVRVEQKVFDELKKFKHLYELQNGRDYSYSDTIILLIEDRVKKKFVLPLVND